jgi:hypothetical protein
MAWTAYFFGSTGYLMRLWCLAVVKEGFDGQTILLTVTCTLDTMG